MKRLIWLALIGTAFAQYTVPYPSHKKASGGGGGAPVVHQSGFCAGSCGGGNAGTITFAGASTAGDSIPVVVYANDRTHTFTPACSGFSLTTINSVNDVNGGKWFWYLLTGAGTCSAVTVTPNAFVGYRAWAWAVSNITAIDSGINSSTGYVVGGTGFSSGSTLSIGPSGTLATANEILFALVAPSGGNGIATISDANGTDGSNPASPDTTTGGTIAYSRIPGSTSTQTFSVTWTSAGTTVEWLLLAFK